MLTPLKVSLLPSWVPCHLVWPILWSVFARRQQKKEKLKIARISPNKQSKQARRDRENRDKHSQDDRPPSHSSLDQSSTGTTSRVVTKTSSVTRNGCVYVPWLVVCVLFVGVADSFLFSFSIKTKETYLNLLFVISDKTTTRGNTCSTTSTGTKNVTDTCWTGTKN